MKPVKIVQIGNLHDHNYDNFVTLTELPEYFEVLGVAELSNKDDRDKNYEGVKRFSLDEVLAMDDLDAVIIEAGKENEIKYAQMFADKGVNVFVDKPGSSNLGDYEKFLKTVEEKKLAFGIGYMYRFNPTIMRALEMAKSGELGNIISVDAEMCIYHQAKKRQWLSRYKGGSLFYLGCHLTDLVCLFKGFPTAVTPYNRPTHTDGVDAEDFGFAVMEYDDGVSTVKVNLGEPGGFMRRQVVVTGTKGTFNIMPTEDGSNAGKYMMVAPAKITKIGESGWENEVENYVCEPYHRYRDMLVQFAKQVRGEAGYVMPLDYELELFKTILKTCGAEDGEVFVPGNIK